VSRFSLACRLRSCLRNCSPQTVQDIPTWFGTRGFLSSDEGILRGVRRPANHHSFTTPPEAVVRVYDCLGGECDGLETWKTSLNQLENQRQMPTPSLTDACPLTLSTERID
jgi:hypothetical protein